VGGPASRQPGLLGTKAELQCHCYYLHWDFGDWLSQHRSLGVALSDEKSLFFFFFTDGSTN
jgi:hypothetical protein